MLSRVSVCNPVHMAANTYLDLHMEQNNHLCHLVPSFVQFLKIKSAWLGSIPIYAISPQCLCGYHFVHV